MNLSLFDPNPSVPPAKLTSRGLKSESAPFVLVPETSEALLSFEKELPVTPDISVTPAPEPSPAVELAPEPVPAPQLAYAAPVAPAPEAKLPDRAPAMPEKPVAEAPEIAPAATDREMPRRKASRARAQGLKMHVQRIQFDSPTLAPFAHTRFCQKYAADCRAQKIVFRPGIMAWNAERQRELVRVNAEVNRAIRPTRVNETVAGEQWLISPKAGDCNDYAVTKRHELLAKGWPARALLLAEVVTTWGEHHLVLVVRTRDGDLVADNLNANIRSWNKTAYQWVRVQSPVNAKYWSTIKTPQADVVAMAAPEGAESGL